MVKTRAAAWSWLRLLPMGAAVFGPRATRMLMFAIRSLGPFLGQRGQRRPMGTRPSQVSVTLYRQICLQASPLT